MRKALFVACAALMLDACAKPTLDTPRASAQEILAEQAQETQIAKQYAGRPLQWNHRVTFEQLQRFLTYTGGRISHAGADICNYFRRNPAGCYYTFILDNHNADNAYADGHSIHITPSLMLLVDNEEELAVILSHEYAHNILGHVNAQRRNGMLGSVLGATLDILAATYGASTAGGFSSMGGHLGQRSYSVAFEREADYVGLYVADRAGYDIRKAPYVWRKMSIRHPGAIYTSTTHPTNADRFVAMEKTVQEILYKKSHHLPLYPNMKPNML